MIKRDDTVRRLETVDYMAKIFNIPIFIFKSENAKAIYIFGKRIYASKIWNKL